MASKRERRFTLVWTILLAPFYFFKNGLTACFLPGTNLLCSALILADLYDPACKFRHVCVALSRKADRPLNNPNTQSVQEDLLRLFLQSITCVFQSGHAPGSGLPG